MPLFTVTVFATGVLFGLLISYFLNKKYISKKKYKEINIDSMVVLSLVERNHALCREIEFMKRRQRLKENSCHF